ncbi:MAG: apolipoprotein N-acyltransferase [Gammaproteobacteria bacterium]
MRFIHWPAERPLLADLFALFAGGTLVLAYAPYKLWPFAVLSPALLFLTWLKAGRARAAWRGYLFGLGQFGLGISWIYYSIHQFGAAVAPLAWFFTLLFVLAMSLYPMLVGWLAHRLSDGRAPAIRLLIIFPAVWVLFEWLRGWLFTGFPWLLLGQAQVVTWLGGSVPVGGEYLAGWLTALSAGLVVIMATGGIRRALLAGVVLVAIWAGSAGLGQIDWTRPAGKPIQVTLVQGNVPQQEKWNPAWYPRTLRRYREMTETNFGSTLIVWPETAIPSYFRDVDNDYLAPLANEVHSHGGTLLTGIFYRDEHNGEIYNAVVAFNPQPEFYFKRHLVPFGEYFPLKPLLGWAYKFFDVPMSNLSPGPGGAVLQAGKYPVGVSICYEDAFASEVRRALPKAQLLVNVSNDAWFGDSLAPHQHLEIARLRALETGRWLLRATNTGISAIINAQGRIVAEADQFKQEALQGEAVPMQGETPYTRFGNTPVILMLVLLVLGPWVWGRVRRED